MKKLALLIISTVVTMSTVSSPMSASAASIGELQQMVQQNGNTVIVSGKNMEEIKEKLLQSGINLDNIELGNCITIPEKPEVPEAEVPETETPKPEVPEVEVPETETPEVPEVEVPETEEGTNAESTFANEVLELVNEERTKRGLTPLTLDKKIEAAALVRAKETEVSFSHTRPNGSSFSTALEEQGVSYNGAGENIAYGQKTPKAVMEGWMNSEGHRANILNAKFTKIGVGYYQNSKGTNYWTQLFTY